MYAPHDNIVVVLVEHDLLDVPLPEPPPELVDVLAGRSLAVGVYILINNFKSFPFPIFFVKEQDQSNCLNLAVPRVRGKCRESQRQK